MGETMKLAVPTMGEAGLESERAGHFGHCDCFTVVEIADGEITGTSEVANPPHEEGGCMRPVGLLAKAGVDAIVAAGMGMRSRASTRRASRCTSKTRRRSWVMRRSWWLRAACR